MTFWSELASFWSELLRIRGEITSYNVRIHSRSYVIQSDTPERSQRISRLMFLVIRLRMFLMLSLPASGSSDPNRFLIQVKETNMVQKKIFEVTRPSRGVALLVRYHPNPNLDKSICMLTSMWAGTKFFFWFENQNPAEQGPS